MVEFKTFQEHLIEPHVNLIWEVTDNWKYEYQTSYDTVRKAYSREGFDPESRIYAFEGEKMVGFVGADIAEQEDKKIARMRLPIALNDDIEICKALMEKIEAYLKAKGVSEIMAPAGVGLGNTIELAEALGFKQQQETFRRTYAKREDLKLSGNTDGVQAFRDDQEDLVKDIFMTKMGMPESQGQGFFEWVLSNSRRKNENQPNSASWQLYYEGDEVLGFSYLMKSDHSPTTAHSMPIYYKSKEGESDLEDVKSVYDKLLSAHLQTLDNVEKVGNYLLPNLYNLEEIYNSLGFEFDPSYIYKKELK